jgi:PhnB protein
MSEVKAIPDGYHSVQPYLYFKSSADAIAFYAKAFGATERLRMAGKDGKIGHAEIQIGDSCVMMADENPAMGALSVEHYGGAPMSLMIYVEDCDAVYAKAIAAGAKSLRKPADQFYGDRMAGVADPFGFQWFIGTHIKDVSKEELEQQHG